MVATTSSVGRAGEESSLSRQHKLLLNLSMAGEVYPQVVVAKATGLLFLGRAGV